MKRTGLRVPTAAALARAWLWLSRFWVTPPRGIRRGAVPLSIMLVSAMPPAIALAERADRDRPVVVESDRMQYDDAKRVNIFTGNVVLTKGTIIIRADRMLVSEDADGFQYGTAWGNLASYRQKRDAPDQYVEGYGLQLEYDGRQEIVRIRGQGLMKRLDHERVTDEIHGSLIVYQSRTEYLTVDGERAVTPVNPGGRVRMVIQPRANAAATGGTTAGGTTSGGTTSGGTVSGSASTAPPLRPEVQMAAPPDRAGPATGTGR